MTACGAFACPGDRQGLQTVIVAVQIHSLVDFTRCQICLLQLI